MFVWYRGHEYQITDYGAWGVRLEQGYGRAHSVLVIPHSELRQEESPVGCGQTDGIEYRRSSLVRLQGTGRFD